MIGTRFSSDELSQNTRGAKEEAIKGPVFITDGDHPTYVLLTIEDYLRLTDAHLNLVEALTPPGADFDFEPSRIGTLAGFLLASPLRGSDLDITRDQDMPRDIDL